MRKTVVALAVLSFCLSTGPAAAEETIRMPGAGVSIAILREMAAQFQKENPGVKFEIPESSGTGGGIKAVGEGKAELGRVGRRPNEKEKSFNLEYLGFAKAPVGFAVHPSVKVAGISAAQSRDIYQGKITNWKEVGGPDLKIRLISRAETEAALTMMRKTIPEWKDWTITANAKQATSDQEMIQFTAETEGAIGFGAIPEFLEKGMKILALGGVAVTDPAYPLHLEMGLVYKPEAMTGNVKKFVDFIFTPAGAAVIRSNSATPVAR